MVLTASPWAVWLWRLASYRTFWLAHLTGRCTRVASPSMHTASPAWAISCSHWPRPARVVMNIPSGWQYPMAANSASSRSMLSPTSVLEMPTILAARRYDSPSSGTAATASKRTSNESGGVPPWPGGRDGSRWARRAASQASTAAGSDERGQYDNGDQTSQAGFENPPMVWSPSTSGRTEHHGHPQSQAKRSFHNTTTRARTRDPGTVQSWQMQCPGAGNGSVPLR